MPVGVKQRCHTLYCAAIRQPVSRNVVVHTYRSFLNSFAQVLLNARCDKTGEQKVPCDSVYAAFIGIGLCSID